MLTYRITRISMLIILLSFSFAANWIPGTALLIDKPIKTCPPGWLAFKDKCFMFSVEKEDWTKAELRCQALGGHLVEILDDETNTFLKNHLKILHYAVSEHSTYYLIGLTDIAKTDTWVWAYSKRIPTFTDWSTGQPDHHQNDEHCVILNGDALFSWHDVDCDRLFHFICQI